MNNIETTSITLTAKLNMNSLISFVKETKSYKSNVALYRNGHSINGKNLTSVITFNLTVKENDSILMITDGEDAETASIQLADWLKKEMDSVSEKTLSFM
ncbi:HPr family phosphocarrier protein [Bacillus sp. NTK071]|uniref:HPr family phosphocarrier protein n=1 Tax=Bacillus sp. NTK071 TaxID=2802175 RepID=UPI001A8C5B3C|nr:HPr family phosphocarrier protein [Bacillus sp. NTK071]MBN8208856.1 HPr family phosphocarrier protein [Bacillus sp. NTK071]